MHFYTYFGQQTTNFITSYLIVYHEIHEAERNSNRKQVEIQLSTLLYETLDRCQRKIHCT